MAKRGNKKREDDLATLDQPASSTSKEFADTNTAIIEYFESIRHEYDCQAEQKTSFENRSGILLSFFGVMFVYLMPLIMGIHKRDAVFLFLHHAKTQE